MQTLETILFWTPIVYVLLINLIAFLAMWWDKWKASKQEWRVAEATLHVIGFIGGAVGIFAGIYRFRHKTQKRSFQALAVVGLVVSLIIYWIIFQTYI
ncbi:MAG: DUF1294 domain-containing protein [Candidatus Thorarchaeota archaeon]|jgi:uncharacterized membrane protein YsdA (DUF1294 family)